MRSWNARLSIMTPEQAAAKIKDLISAASYQLTNALEAMGNSGKELDTKLNSTMDTISTYINDLLLPEYNPNTTPELSRKELRKLYNRQNPEGSFADWMLRRQRRAK